MAGRRHSEMAEADLSTTDKTEGFHVSPLLRQMINATYAEQRSEEWFEQRKGRITGSMCDTLLGKNRFQTWDQVVAEKAGMPASFQGNAATQHGIDNESTAIRLYEEQTGRTAFELGLVKHPTEHILAHSPDGISLRRIDTSAAETSVDTEPLLLEIKCPLTRPIKEGKVPPYYMGQLQLGMVVFDVSAADFVQYKPDPFKLDITRVQRDEGWLATNMPIFERFWADVGHWRTVGWWRHPFVQRERRKLFLSYFERYGRSRLRQLLA